MLFEGKLSTISCGLWASPAQVFPEACGFSFIFASKCVELRTAFFRGKFYAAGNAQGKGRIVEKLDTKKGLSGFLNGQPLAMRFFLRETGGFKQPGHGRNCRLRLLSGLPFLGLRSGYVRAAALNPAWGFAPTPTRDQSLDPSSLRVALSRSFFYSMPSASPINVPRSRLRAFADRNLRSISSSSPSSVSVRISRPAA